MFPGYDGNHGNVESSTVRQPYGDAYDPCGLTAFPATQIRSVLWRVHGLAVPAWQDHRKKKHGEHEVKTTVCFA